MRFTPHSLPRRLLLALFAAFALVAAAPAAANADQLRGAQVHSLWSNESTADALREIDMLADAGANSVRIDISWSSLETEGKGQYSPWFVDRADAVFQHANERGLKVVGVLWSTPCWASSAPDSLKQGCAGDWWNRDVDRYAPNNMDDFGDAAAYVAKRWGSELAGLEIWNEPNLADQYTLHTPDPAAADAQLLKAAYPRIKAQAPQLPVLAGVLSGSDGDFLNALYRKGIAGNFDGISIHPYNEWRSPDDAWQDQYKQWSFLRGVPWIHQIMAAHGDGDKGIWLTEFGFSTCGNGDRWCVSQQNQATYIRQSFQIASQWSYVKAALVYNLRNKGNDPSGREDQFGLLNRDFSPKPAWAAFKQAMGDAPGAGANPDYTENGSSPGSGSTTVGLTQAPQVAAPVVTVTSAGIAPVPLTCPATASRCSGKLTIETKPIRTGKHGAKRSVRLGGRNVKIKRGGSKIVRIAIPKRYRALLKSLGKVRVRVTVETARTVGAASTRKSGLTLRTAKLATR